MKRSGELRILVVLASWPIAAVGAWVLVSPWATLAVWAGYWPAVFAIALVREGRRERHLDRRPSRGGTVVRGPWSPRLVNHIPIAPLDDPDGGRRADA